ncbi:MAG: hypothetical protein R2769_06870 [Saprospiraceae bacterium]
MPAFSRKNFQIDPGDGWDVDGRKIPVRASGIIATTFTKSSWRAQERVRVKLRLSWAYEEANQLANALIGTAGIV